jgi:hypothetical protein
MEVSPFFDTTDSVWVAEIDGVEFYADSLRELQARLPEVQIKDYYPNGFTAARSGFLEASTRVPFVTAHTISRLKQRRIDYYRRKDPPIESPVAPPEPKVSNHDTIMNLAAQGWRSPAIAAYLHLTLATIQIHRLQAYRDKDPRALPRPARISIRVHPSRSWTPEEDAALRTHVAEGFSSNQIGAILNRTRNSIIGRAHRNGLALHGDPNAGRPRRFLCQQ